LRAANDQLRVANDFGIEDLRQLRERGHGSSPDRKITPTAALQQA
jgi:hypothetical protein